MLGSLVPCIVSYCLPSVAANLLVKKVRLFLRDSPWIFSLRYQSLISSLEVFSLCMPVFADVFFQNVQVWSKSIPR